MAKIRKGEHNHPDYSEWKSVLMNELLFSSWKVHFKICISAPEIPLSCPLMSCLQIFLDCQKTVIVGCKLCPSSKIHSPRHNCWGTMLDSTMTKCGIFWTEVRRRSTDVLIGWGNFAVSGMLGSPHFWQK